MPRMLPDWIDGFMKLAEEEEPPTIYDKWVAVSTIASVLQRECWLPWLSSAPDYPNFYIVLTGPPGCRKSTAMAQGRNMLESLGIMSAPQSITREAFIEMMRKDIREFSYGGGIITHSSMTVHSSELVVFLGRGKADAQIIYDLTDWYDNPSIWTYRTKGRGPEEIKNVFINLIGGTTPETLQDVISPIVVGGGLTSRMLFVFADHKKKSIPIPDIASDRVEKLRNALKHDLGAIQRLRGPFSVTPGYKELYAEWYYQYNDNPPNFGRHYLGYVDRRSTHLRKLTQVLAASRNGAMLIEEEDFIRADEFLSEMEARMYKAFEYYGRAINSEITRNIAKYIASLPRVVTEAELLREFQGDIESLTQLHGMLELLNRSKAYELKRNRGLIEMRYIDPTEAKADD